jgi:hypothetical protein
MLSRTMTLPSPGGPEGPFGPIIPGGPCWPFAPFAPFSPGGPCRPAGPATAWIGALMTDKSPGRSICRNTSRIWPGQFMVCWQRDVSASFKLGKAEANCRSAIFRMGCGNGLVATDEFERRHFDLKSSKSKQSEFRAGLMRNLYSSRKLHEGERLLKPLGVHNRFGLANTVRT